MEASVVDLRYKMNDVLKALDRKEEVTNFTEGKSKGKSFLQPKKPSEKFNPILSSVGQRKQERQSLRN